MLEKCQSVSSVPSAQRKVSPIEAGLEALNLQAKEIGRQVIRLEEILTGCGGNESKNQPPPEQPRITDCHQSIYNELTESYEALNAINNQLREVLGSKTIF